MRTRYDPGHLHRLGRELAAGMLEGAAAQLAFCSKPPVGLRAPLVIKYSELIRNPLEVVQSIYHHVGRVLSAETTEAMTAHLAENRQHKDGRPRYSLDKFGLSEETLREQFVDYLAIL